MIILFNFNTYLGGGETLFVRFVQYLERTNVEYIAFCKKESFIFRELNRQYIPSQKFIGISSDVDYYYLSKKKRNSLLCEISEHITSDCMPRFLTFCMRDLYIVGDLNNSYKTSISHLILHNQDYLYVCQTLLDKLKYKLSGKRKFTFRKSIEFNNSLLTKVNNHHGIIPMSWIITQMWKKELGIAIPESSIVPTPCFSKNYSYYQHTNGSDKSILWIGRLVDFKFASLFVILNFIKRHPDYSLSIVGDGNRKVIDKYIEKNGIPKDKISFLGQVKYENLKDIILNHSIGYASGTSIIEMTKYGLPVVMALQDNIHKPFKRDICGGLFCNTTKGNFAEELCIYNEDEINYTIDDAFKEINADYPKCAKDCYDYTASEYDEDVNFAKYVELINVSQPILEYTRIPQASLLRKLIFRLPI